MIIPLEITKKICGHLDILTVINLYESSAGWARIMNEEVFCHVMQLNCPWLEPNKFSECDTWRQCAELFAAGVDPKSSRPLVAPLVCKMMPMDYSTPIPKGAHVLASPQDCEFATLFEHVSATLTSQGILLKDSNTLVSLQEGLESGVVPPTKSSTQVKIVSPHGGKSGQAPKYKISKSRATKARKIAVSSEQMSLLEFGDVQVHVPPNLHNHRTRYFDSLGLLTVVSSVSESAKNHLTLKYKGSTGKEPDLDMFVEGSEVRVLADHLFVDNGGSLSYVHKDGSLEKTVGCTGAPVSCYNGLWWSWESDRIVYSQHGLGPSKDLLKVEQQEVVLNCARAVQDTKYPEFAVIWDHKKNVPITVVDMKSNTAQTLGKRDWVPERNGVHYAVFHARQLVQYRFSHYYLKLRLLENGVPIRDIEPDFVEEEEPAEEEDCCSCCSGLSHMSQATKERMIEEEWLETNADPAEVARGLEYFWDSVYSGGSLGYNGQRYW